MKLPWSIALFCLAPTLILGDLGSYTGQYGVGSIDIEVPASSPGNVTDTTFKNGTYAFKLDTVYFTLYYPITPGTKSNKPQHPWLPPPKDLIAQGLSNSIGGSVSAGLIQIGFSAFANNLTIPAEVDAPLLPGTSKLPIMTFSHGNPTMSQWYSQFYGEVASHGIVVAAVTHRDASSPATQVKFKNGTFYNLVALTSAQVNPLMDDAEFHLKQLEMRQKELNEATRVLSSINEGNGSSISDANSRGEGQDLGSWKDRLDLANIIIAGQSFGANTVLRYLNESNPVLAPGAGAAFDPGKDSGPFPTISKQVPLLIPDSEEWSAIPTNFYGKPHFDVVKSIAETSLSATNATWFFTLLGTTHVSISDVGVIASSFAQFFTNSTQFLQLDPKYAIRQFSYVTIDFATFLQNRTLRNGLLASNVTYPNFQLFPNVNALNNPWEVHVAPKSSLEVGVNSTTKISSSATIHAHRWLLATSLSMAMMLMSMI